jgi:hypothetical protein
MDGLYYVRFIVVDECSDGLVCPVYRDGLAFKGGTPPGMSGLSSWKRVQEADHVPFIVMD